MQLWMSSTVRVSRTVPDPASMPQRTIVFGDKSASEVMRELLTIGQFAST